MNPFILGKHQRTPFQALRKAWSDWLMAAVGLAAIVTMPIWMILLGWA